MVFDQALEHTGMTKSAIAFTIEARHISFDPGRVVIKVRAQIRFLDQDFQMVRRLSHRPLHELDLRLLACALQLPPRCLELLPRSA